MLSTIPYTALLSPTPIFSSSSIAVLMFWPRPPMHVDAHTTLYTLHSIPYTALLGPIPICSSSSSAFLMFWPSPPMHVKDQPDLTRHSLHSSPSQPSPCRLLCLTLLQSFLVILVLPLLFFCFDPPQCTSMHGPGGNRTPPSPNCHLAHWPQNRPPWPPQMVGELPQIGWFRHAAPQTRYSHFVRNEQLQPSLTAGFRNIYIYMYIIYIYIRVYIYILYHWGATECPGDVFSNPHCLDEVNKQNDCKHLAVLANPRCSPLQALRTK